MAAGEKEWVCAHGGDHELLTSGSGSRAFGYKDDDDDGGAPIPPLPSSRSLRSLPRVFPLPPPHPRPRPHPHRGAPLPDLFARDLFETWPHARSARLYRGVQRAGDARHSPVPARGASVHPSRSLSRRGRVLQPEPVRARRAQFGRPGRRGHFAHAQLCGREQLGGRGRRRDAFDQRGAAAHGTPPQARVETPAASLELPGPV